MTETKRIVLTGGTGMVGQNFRDLISATQHELIAPSRADLDLLDTGAVRTFIRDAAPNLVIHAAGRVGGIHANMAAPFAFLSDNLEMGRNVVLATRAVDDARLINLGSSCMYPREAENPLREDMILSAPLEPTNEGYALAKIAVMRLCQYANLEEGQERFKTIIPCNLYGPYDTFSDTASHLIPAILVKLHRAKRDGLGEVDIWGTGEARREFMHAGDVANALLKAVEDFNSLPTLMNLGIGTDHSVNDYYQVAADVVGWQGKFVHDTSKPVGMMRKLVATDRQAIWGWAPTFSLEQGLEATYNHYLERHAA